MGRQAQLSAGDRAQIRGASTPGFFDIHPGVQAMSTYRGAWTAEEVASFLDETTVPIRIATHRPSGSLWIVALWYRFRDGVFECATEANADIVKFLRADGSLAFDVSTNDIPYRGVRGAGSATIEPEGGTDLLRELLERYMGGTDSDLAQWLLRPERDEVRIRIEPDDVYSWDYSGRM